MNPVVDTLAEPVRPVRFSQQLQNLARPFGDRPVRLGELLAAAQGRYFEPRPKPKQGSANSLKQINSVLLKRNKIDTVLETLETGAMAQKANYTVVISH